MATVWIQGWIEDDEGYIRHDGYRIYTTLAEAIEATDKREKAVNSPNMVSSEWRDGPPFAQDVPDAVYEKAKAKPGFFVYGLSDLNKIQN